MSQATRRQVQAQGPTQGQTHTHVPALEVRGLHKRFGATAVLQGVDLRVAVGERLAVIGPNGAGKSTLFDIISGLTRPSAGEVHLHGQRVDSQAPFAVRRLGLARSFQRAQVFGRLSVRDNLRCAVLWSLGHGHSGLKALAHLPDVNHRVDAWLHRMGLEGCQHQLADQLTYAQQRALDLGMAVAGDATVWLLDEPTAGMSQAEARHFSDLVRTLSAGKTLLLVEHDMRIAFELADRVAVLHEGRVLACDTPARVQAHEQVQAVYLRAAAPQQAAGAAQVGR